jgi:hypothetical protein
MERLVEWDLDVEKLDTGDSAHGTSRWRLEPPFLSRRSCTRNDFGKLAQRS